jgi:hypothetical protein
MLWHLKFRRSSPRSFSSSITQYSVAQQGEQLTIRRRIVLHRKVSIMLLVNVRDGVSVYELTQQTALIPLDAVPFSLPSMIIALAIAVS